MRMENERLSNCARPQHDVVFSGFFSSARASGCCAVIAALTPLGRCSGSNLAEILDQAQSVTRYGHPLNAVRPKTRTQWGQSCSRFREAQPNFPSSQFPARSPGDPAANAARRRRTYYKVRGTRITKCEAHG